MLTVLALAGCAPTAPQVDIEAEKAAIGQMLADWLEATNKPVEEGADEYVSYATEDAVWLPPNAERIDGRAGIREWALQPTGAEDFSVDWKTTSIEVAADGRLAYAIGTYELSQKDASRNPVSDKGKWVNVYKKQADGSWKCSVAMWSSDLPAAE
jgi:ketosteroid isomerase-like protein